MTNFTHTVGGQPVGRSPLMCEPKGASDYCQHCGRHMVSDDESPCSVLEELRLQQIRDEDIAAFGCWIESAGPTEGLRCEKWCHKSFCAFSYKTKPGDEQTGERG